MKHKEAGSALVYILVAVGLFAALTFSLTRGGGTQATAQQSFDIATELKSQIEFIRAAVQECVLKYPGGDTTINVDSTTDAGYHHPYPLEPDSTHLDTPDGNNQVQYLRCPGNPGDDDDHADIFGGSTGKFFPPMPDSIGGEWLFYNGTDGVFFWLDEASADATVVNAFSKLNDTYSTCEVDTIDATGGVENMDSDGPEYQCTSGSTCLRVWILSESSAVYPDESANCP